MEAIFRRILGRTHTTARPTKTKRKSHAIASVLITGARGAGIDALGRRLGREGWIDGYDPTGNHDYSKGHPQPDGGFVVLEYMAYSWADTVVDGRTVAWWDYVIRERAIFLLVYRVDDDKTFKGLEDVYTTYIVPKQPPAVRVCIIATCADLLPPDGTGRELITKGQALSKKYGLNFHLISSRTAEGCRELESSLIAAALKSR